MKKLLVVLMAASLLGAIPVLAAEHGDMKMDTQDGMKMDMHDGMKMDMHDGMKMDTDEGARQCALEAESIQQKIKRIQNEIKSGSKAHSAQELKRLQDKLKEANQLLDTLQKQP